MKLWIARDEDGRLYLHSIKPYLRNVKSSAYWDNEVGNWMQLRETDFPEVTFEDSPKEIEITVIES